MRTGRFRGALLSALVIASLITPFLLLSPSPVHAALTPHDPIYIDGNAGFTPENGVNGGGSGTENDSYIIENWVIDASTADGIDIMNTTAHFVVRNCVVENGWGAHPNRYYGIYLYNVVNGRIENNTCENNYRGISLGYSDNNTLTNNICVNNNEGISLWRSSNNLLSNNIVKNNYYWGIFFEDGADGNIIESCTVENSGTGLYLRHTQHNIVKNNGILNNQYYGIRVENYPGSNNIMRNNTLNNNNTGISLNWATSNNSVYHNNFINNTNQAHDDGSQNLWDNGYPWGGNYWSDYAGADIYGGEDQNLSGSDRIGDTPYYIPGDNNLDRYPLMNPFPLSWTGWASVQLPPIFPVRPLIWSPSCIYSYSVSLETNLALYQGSKLVAKFYTYGGSYQGENVVWSGTTPDNVSFSKIVPHPQYGWAEKVRLDLTYNNTDNVISTIASFTVCKVVLEIRFSEIPLWWALSPPEDRICIEILFSELPLRWALAPPC